jgi:hypothetical protein
LKTSCLQFSQYFKIENDKATLKVKKVLRRSYEVWLIPPQPLRIEGKRAKLDGHGVKEAKPDVLGQERSDKNVGKKRNGETQKINFLHY